ncbi:isocitrate lyase/PEP mutase family protein [Aeromicrobium sp. CF3.5]|uniref:isocitrate lyase/PEP mutase family protein n=1 Tax=Aeromicrobium sp. CF3.5 TaxID=3373078 RepID=UPI003EE4375F
MTSSTNPTDPAPSQADRARDFHALHTIGVLVLPNAWDVASAVVVRDAGARAVATTSAGAAWSLGAPDGERLARDRAVDLIARITAVLDGPVTADIEAGYGADPDQVAATAHAMLEAGAVGVNLEDACGARLWGQLEQAERIAAVRATADEADVPMFINARIDTYVLQVGEPEKRLSETIRRADAYLAAGADGIFVPGLMDAGAIRDLTAAVPAPVNIMAGPGALTVAQLTDLGVRRVSVGMAIAQGVYAYTRRAAVELLNEGTYRELAEGMDYAELNAALAAHFRSRPGRSVAARCSGCGRSPGPPADA